MSSGGLVPHGLAIAAALATAAGALAPTAGISAPLSGFGRMCGDHSGRIPASRDSRDERRRDCPAGCHAACLRQTLEEDEDDGPGPRGTP